VAVLYSKGVCLVFSSSREIHRDKVHNGAHGHIKLHEKEKVQVVRAVVESERLNDAFVTKSKGEAQEQYNQRHA